MKLTAVNVKTGKILMSQSGAMSSDAFKRTVAHNFPDLESDHILVMSDGEQLPHGQQAKASRNQKSVIWRGSFCLMPDSKVLTTNGIKEIKDVVPGDMVFTHAGRPRSVIRTSRRPFKGDMVSIQAALDDDRMVLTPNHKMIAMRGTPCVLKKAQTCKPTCRTQHNLRKYMTNDGEKECSRCTERPYQGYAVEQVRAGELTTRDFLLLPKLSPDERVSKVNVLEYIGLDGYDKWSSDGKWVWPTKKHNASNLATVARSIGVKESLLYHQGKASELNAEMIEAAIEAHEEVGPSYDIESRVNRIPVEVDLDYDFGRFMGLYVAEGSAGYATSFAFHEDESEFHEFVEHFIKSRLGLYSSRNACPEKKSLCIVASSVILGRFLSMACGRDSRTKRVPDFIFSASDEAISGFIDGLWDGDGTKTSRKKDNTIKYGCASLSLVYGLRLLLSRFDVSAAISTEQQTGFGRRFTCHNLRISGDQLYENEWLRKFKYNHPKKAIAHPRSRQYFPTEHGCFVQITLIEKKPYDGDVFDLEVDGDHTFTVNGKSILNSDLGGYANMNREIGMRLAHHGFGVKIEMLKTGHQVDPGTMNLLRAMESTRLANESSCPLVVGFTPMPVVRGRRRVIFYTMMETQKLHPEFVARCNQSASEVWVPCRFYEKVFKESGVVKPITVIPLGVNQYIYTPGAPCPSLTYEEMPSGERVRAPKGGYKFMSLFGWSYRKGTDVLCRSFLKEFDAADDVALVIYSRYMGSAAEVHKEYVRAEIRGYYAECTKPNPARIYYCGDEIPITDLPGAYCAADCFVFCSRGEGFGLPVIEAAACGLPIISAFNTSMTQYLDDDCAYLVRPEGIGPANDKLTWISGYYRDQDFAIMGDVSVAEFGAHMRAAYSKPWEAAEKAARLRKNVLENYTWDLCAARVAQKLSSP